MIVESYEDVIVLSGTLRSNFWDTIHTAISLTLKRHPSGVIIDCSGITGCAVEGADTFRDIMEFIENHDARVIVAAVPKELLDVLKSVPEVRSQLPIAASVAEARRSLDLLAEPEQNKKKKKHADQPALRKVLVCLSGEEGDEYILLVAKELAEAVFAEICLLFPVIVPRELPIQSPLPESEELAAKSFEEAQKKLKESDVRISVHLERGRDVASIIHGSIDSLKVSQVLVALPTEGLAEERSMKLVKAVLSKVKKPVLFVRGPV